LEFNLVKAENSDETFDEAPLEGGRPVSFEFWALRAAKTCLASAQLGTDRNAQAWAVLLFYLKNTRAGLVE